MADADCQTAGPSHSVLAVQTDLTAVNSELVEKRNTSEDPLYPELTTRQMQDELATRLGVDVDLVKQLADTKQAGAHVSVTRTPTEMLQPVAVPTRRSPRWRTRLASVPVAKAPAYLVNASSERIGNSMQSSNDALLTQVFPNSARPYVSQLLDSGLSLVLYTATIYLIGVLVSGNAPCLLSIRARLMYPSIRVRRAAADSCRSTIATTSRRWTLVSTLPIPLAGRV